MPPGRLKIVYRVALLLLPAATLASGFAAFGAWIGWQGAVALPANSVAAALATQLAGPTAKVEIGSRHDAAFGYENHDARLAQTLIGDDDYNGGSVQVLVSGASINTIRAALVNADWRTGPEFGQPGVSALSGPLAIEVYPADDGARLLTATNGTVAVEIGRAEPSRVRWLTGIGYLVGLVLGWLLAIWVDRRTRALQRRRAVVLAALTGLVLLLPATIITTGDLLYARLVLPATITAPAAWGDYTFFGVRLLVNVGLLILLSTAVIAFRRPKATAPDRPAAIA